MIKKILFATDLGAYASLGLLHVESLARSLKATVSVIHAVPPIGDFAAAVVKSHCSDEVKREVLQTSHIKGLLETMREQVFEVLAREPFDENGLLPLVTDIIVLPGHPAVVILSEAERIGADIIVIGSHSTDSIDGRLLGSVATRVLQLAKVPVFMVPMMSPQGYMGLSRGGDSRYRA